MYHWLVLKTFLQTFTIFCQLHKGGGDENFQKWHGAWGKARNAGMEGWGLVLYCREMEKFLKSLYIVGRRVLTLLFYEVSPHIVYLLLFKFCPLASLISLLPTLLTPTVVSAVLFLWLNGWSRHIWCAVFLTDNIDLHMSSLGTLVPERPWCDII